MNIDYLELEEIMLIVCVTGYGVFLGGYRAKSVSRIHRPSSTPIQQGTPLSFSALLQLTDPPLRCLRTSPFQTQLAYRTHSSRLGIH